MLRQPIRSETLLLLREAFTSLLPIVLVMNILVLLSGLTGLLESWGIMGATAINGNEVSRLYYFLIPLFLNIALSTLLAKEKDLEQIGTVLISMVCFFRISGFLTVNESAQLISYHGSILISIPATLVSVRLLHYFTQFPRLRLVRRRSDLSPLLKKTLNLLLPGLLTLLCFELVSHGLRFIGGTGALALLVQALPRFSQLNEIQEVILFKLISLLTWFLGIHGEHSAEGLFRLFNDIPVGEASAIHLKTFHDVFMNIGGSGSTFVIPLLILFTQKSTQFKAIAQLSLPFAFFNVNEILIFGLPILLNPIFLVPFLLAPFVNMAIALTAIHLGAFAIDPTEISWMSPPLYSAYIASGGSGWAVFTNLLCMVVDGCLYYPFLVFAQRQFKIPFYLFNLFGEDVYGFFHNEIKRQEERLFIDQQMGQLDTLMSAQQVLRQLRGGQFLLYFQPKVEATSGHLVGLEALMRFQNVAGEILPPSFLPVLYEQGLSKVVDQKVVDLVLEQVQQWRTEQLLFPPISINFDKDFLLDPLAIQTFIEQTRQQGICFELEITEHTYTVELDALASVIRQLRAEGHRVSIDDFGAGYSSLTSLLSLEADEIKLDRKLVVAPRGEKKRGRVLLESSVQLCHDLGFLVVAEGVETQGQLNLVRDCGVDVVQGYYTGKPMPPEQVSRLFPQVGETEDVRSLFPEKPYPRRPLT
ncbi:MAG: EAL domain-containing protein [Thermosynechococcaceae cyanobacterium]